VGHNIQPDVRIIDAEGIIMMDTGCVYKGHEDYGKLSAIDLETMQVYTQANIDTDNKNEPLP
jgi:hypothetical protein